MDFRIFMETVDKNLSRFQSEGELKEWVRNYARSIEEERREDFLEQLGTKEYRSHEDMLQEITAWCEKIDEEAITLFCEGHEEYDPEYWTWDPDWVIEYEDPEGIGTRLKHYYEEAEQAVYDRDYKAANLMYWNLGTLSITAESADGMDPVDLTVEEMVSEGLVKLNLKKIAALALYAAYQTYPMPERLPRIYGYFSWKMFETTGIEDMLASGREPLENVGQFLEEWIAFLRNQNDRYTSRLLIEAVALKDGEEGLLKEAKLMANVQPALYIEALERLYQKEDWVRLKEEGMEALRLMKRTAMFRERAARLAAAGAVRIRAVKTEKRALAEAFWSKPTAANYFRLITCQAGDGQEQGLAVRGQSDEERIAVRFLAGDYQAIWDRCKKTKRSLGWSGEFISPGISMLLVYLHHGDLSSAVMRKVAQDIKIFIGYQEEYGEPDFMERLEVWRKTIVIPEEKEKEILAYLAGTIDQRVEAIVGGNHRKSYWKAAKLGAALGEVEESLGKKNGKSLRIQKYQKQFSRHRAFKEEISKF